MREALVIYVSANSPLPPEIADMIAAMQPGGTRRAQRPGPVYVLTALDSPGPGLRKTADDTGSGFFVAVSTLDLTRTEGGMDRGVHSIGPISVRGTTLSQFVLVLESFLDAAVMDDTGLNGLFDIELHGQYDNADDLIAALLDQLGLSLTKN